MSNYAKLKNSKKSKDLPKEFVERFEHALKSCFDYYVTSGQCTVDALENNPMELAYAKGFLAGCIYVDNLNNK